MNDLKLQFIFVHGLSGWGSYDKVNKRMPYWGMRGADLMVWLRSKGFDCYAASVSPTGSAWDRACELYAQLAGARVDYGEKHSSRSTAIMSCREYGTSSRIWMQIICGFREACCESMK